MRGSIQLPVLFGSYFTVAGGPYMRMPRGFVGVKMAEEIDAPCEVDLPVRDFCIPSHEAAAKALCEVVGLVVRGKPLYVGCMGGIGRTGLMLALLAKAWGIENPVQFVRSAYYGHAVETKEQQQFIQDFVVPHEVRFLIFWAKAFNVFSWNKNLTKNLTP